jgi:competence protein ComEC
MKKHSNEQSVIILFALAALTGFVWYHVVFGAPANFPRMYFLDVGQGDGELAIFPGNVKVMTDAGPDRNVVASLEKVMPPGDRYIDIAVISHPQLDHFNGFNYVLDQYTVGVFIMNGRVAPKTVSEWPLLLEKIKGKNIPLITLGAGDGIRYGDNEVSFLSPDGNLLQSAELNDTGFVELIKMSVFRTLLTADIDSNVENYLLQSGVNIRADVLKVPHHGSKYSSSDAFLASVKPKIAAIEVGKGNTYGHPTKEALARLASTTVNVFRTDQRGTIEIRAEAGRLRVFTEK